MKTAKVVIGSAYGDEGKGVFTDFLSSQSVESMVIRFNGGAQAGHTVITPTGQRHVFGHFGANSFLPNAKTVLSKFFVVNPLLFAKEKIILKTLGINPSVFIHRNSYVTTPFEMILNQWQEHSRGNARHGSCGVGFGETVEREEVGGVVLQMKDFGNIEFEKKLFQVRDYFVTRAKKLGFNSYLEQNDFVFQDGLVHKFIEDCEVMLKDIVIFDKILPSSENIVFEGAQGLLLDQSFGYFPHVTRSNTGLKNVVDIAKDYNIGELDVVYATRCYTTRHGRGPLKNELSAKPYSNVVDETNIPNPYQEALRFAYLDLDLLKATIEKDMQSVDLNNIKLKASIGISCLDQTNVVKAHHDGRILECSNTQFAKRVSEYFSMPTLESWKGDRENVFRSN